MGVKRVKKHSLIYLVAAHRPRHIFLWLLSLDFAVLQQSCCLFVSTVQYMWYKQTTMSTSTSNIDDSDDDHSNGQVGTNAQVRSFIFSF